jgi:RHS repeat-associated protein
MEAVREVGLMGSSSGAGATAYCARNPAIRCSTSPAWNSVSPPKARHRQHRRDPLLQPRRRPRRRPYRWRPHLDAQRHPDQRRNQRQRRHRSTTRRRYLPFGADRSPATIVDSWTSERGFLDKTTDSTTGLSHIGAREYDTLNGRFLTPDPLADPANQQNNAYAYAANNPVTFSDPTGLSPEDAQFWVFKPAAAEKRSHAASTQRYGRSRPCCKRSWKPDTARGGTPTSETKRRQERQQREDKRTLDRGISLAGDLVIAPTPEDLTEWLDRAEDSLCVFTTPLCDRSDPNFEYHAHHYICSNNPDWCGTPADMAPMPPNELNSRLGKFLGKALPRALQVGRNSAKGHHVYLGVDGKPVAVYAGRTNDLARRTGEHGTKFVGGLRAATTGSGVTKGQAKAIEQALIVRGRAGHAPFTSAGVQNRINSISPKHVYYNDAVQRGEARLRLNGFRWTAKRTSRSSVRHERSRSGGMSLLYSCSMTGTCSVV